MTARRRAILIIEQNDQFREELYNFLLSAGYENVSATENLSTALDKIQQAEYEIVVANAGSPHLDGLQQAQDLAQLSPRMKVILMIKADDQQTWNRIATQMGEVHFLIKPTFAQNLLYLLEENSPP